MNQEDADAQRRELNALSGKIIGMCIEIHRQLGPGLLESAYEECLAYELSQPASPLNARRTCHFGTRTYC